MTTRPFAYAADVTQRFPTARAAVVTADGVDNSAPPDGLAGEYAAVQSEVLARLADLPIAEHDSIRAWRRTFTELGVKPTQYRCAPEALLRRLQRHGDVPSISPLVDIGNLVSIEFAIPVAVFDADAVDGIVECRFARGDEEFIGIGSDTPEPVAAGEIVFADESDQIAARKWCWKQGAPTAAGPTTTSALVVIETAHDRGADDLERAATRLEQLLRGHRPGAQLTRSSAPS
ncbi:MAG: phenylalanine--tRNA ligase beta subunit-related protein [Actinomycetota bacterium]